MKLLKRVEIITVFLTILILVSTSYSADKNGFSPSRFQITDKKIRGWVADENGYKEFGPEELFDIINGGAEIYVNQGLQKGIYQRLIKGNKYQCEIFVEDYGSSKNAKNVFVTTTETASDPPKLNAGNSDRIKIKEFIGGILIYLHRKNYYFEISVSGFDTFENAITNVEPFIVFFENILSEK